MTKKTPNQLAHEELMRYFQPNRHEFLTLLPVHCQRTEEISLASLNLIIDKLSREFVNVALSPPNKLEDLTQLFKETQAQIISEYTTILVHSERVKDHFKKQLHTKMLDRLKLGLKTTTLGTDHESLTKKTKNLITTYLSVNSLAKEISARESQRNLAGIFKSKISSTTSKLASSLHKIFSAFTTYFVDTLRAKFCFKEDSVKLIIFLNQLYQVAHLPPVKFVDENSLSPLHERTWATLSAGSSTYVQKRIDFVQELHFMQMAVQTRYGNLSHQQFPLEIIPVELLLCKENDLAITVIGCHGVPESPRSFLGLIRSLKNRLEKIKPETDALRQLVCEQPKDFLIAAGDNVYEHGAGTPKEVVSVHRPFGYKPIYAVPGNHDYGIWSHGISGPGSQTTDEAQTEFEQHEKRSIGNLSGLGRCWNQVLASYGPDQERPHQNKSAGYLTNWNMPFRYYAMKLEQFKTAILYIDSNLIMFDPLQQTWLYEAINRYNKSGYKIHIVSHHPLYYFGKKAKKDKDPEWYSYRTKISSWQKNPVEATPVLCTFTPGNNQKTFIERTAYHTIGDFLQAYLVENKLISSIDSWICAHEHLSAVTKLKFKSNDTNTIMQFTVGGGGAGNEKKLCSEEQRHPNHLTYLEAPKPVCVKLTNGFLNLTILNSGDLKYSFLFTDRTSIRGQFSTDVLLDSSHA